MLSQKAKYALKATGYLAAHYGQGPILMPVIAQEKNIPLRFLENIFHQLKQAGLLTSHRGRQGAVRCDWRGAGFYIRRMERQGDD